MSVSKKFFILFVTCGVCYHRNVLACISRSAPSVIDPCGDSTWVPYKTEKCFKLLDTELVAAADGASLCSEMSSSLLTIDSAEEQAFISTYAFVTRRVVENVWLAAHRIPQTDNFRWDADHSLVHLDFWAPSTPSSNQGHECLQMTPHMPHFPQDTDHGLWMDTSCQGKSLVICQKQFQLSQETLQKLLLNAMKEIKIQKEDATQLKEKLATLEEAKSEFHVQQRTLVEIQKYNATELNAKLEEAMKVIETQGKLDEEIQKILIGMHMQKMSERSRRDDLSTGISLTQVVPVGFTYVQYPSQAAPSTLWPSFNWTQVTSQTQYEEREFYRSRYANTNARALGFGQSATIQTGLIGQGRSLSSARQGVQSQANPKQLRPIKIWTRSS